ncbi:MAG TPA: KH domain-containing protein [Vicinamibacterales bacterium]|nr:KH domain-containing protein [Vicinamibacterales bacterium]HOG30035.1 KH domain-containing protein [Vicinamibacterales bacterium]HOQ60844.1 KH domain-containing protein [Vicinamibacterales bacterium]HPW20871.1 KH domain-containing protein [Vicinamibacterales bacterium]
MSRARDVAETVTRALVDRPAAVRVTESAHRDGAIVEVVVAGDDLGRVIGRQGRTAGAIRTLVAAAAEREGMRASVEFRDEHGQR